MIRAMQLERTTADVPEAPFPIYADVVSDLLHAHGSGRIERDSTAAHLLAVCSGYAYSDLSTVAMMASRLGLGESACVSVAQLVDAMFIFSTAFLVQSRCGRVVILCYRGTEPSNLASWLGDVDVGADSICMGDARLDVHCGFHRNMLATRWTVLRELHAALEGRSLADPGLRVEHPLEALYVTGHSLGGAMAVLFALSLAGDPEHRALAERLRAVYTFGQPLTAGVPVPDAALEVGRRIFRHVNARDPIPALPPETWGHLEHFGQEYRCVNGQWVRAGTAVVQLKNFREFPRSVFALFASGKRRQAARYTMADHGPHQYISTLRPKGRVTEFGDQS